jgi:hypothetical protein
MRDIGLQPDTELAPADQAVKYLLDRIQNDANLRYHMLHTQAFTLLVEAEAARLGMPIDAVRDKREQDAQPDYARRRPDLVEARAALKRLLVAARDVVEDFLSQSKMTALEQAAVDAERWCP